MTFPFKMGLITPDVRTMIRQSFSPVNPGYSCASGNPGLFVILAPRVRLERTVAFAED